MQIPTKASFKSRFLMTGTLTIRVRDARTGKLLRTWTKRNTITYAAGDLVRALLAQRATDPAPAEYQFGSMRFGTDSTSAERSQTNLITEVIGVRRELIDAAKVDGVSGEISLEATLGAVDGNGETYREAGLFTLGAGAFDANQGGTLQMFSRQVHPPLTKSSAIIFDYSWTIQFTT
jgi:hypothetical protein